VSVVMEKGCGIVIMIEEKGSGIVILIEEKWHGGVGEVEIVVAVDQLLFMVLVVVVFLLGDKLSKRPKDVSREVEEEKDVLFYRQEFLDD